MLAKMPIGFGETMTVFPKICLDFLKRIYVDTTASVVCIGGLWKTGKTDFALLFAEEFRKMGWTQHFASNIETDAEWIDLVCSLNRLKAWSSTDRLSKLFIYDETIESTPSRRAMSTLNVEFVKFLPQASKKHLHIFVLLQTENIKEEHFIDSIWLTNTFNRGVWMKTSKTTANFNSSHLKVFNYELNNIPPTRIDFDPDRPASFALTDEVLNFDTLPDVLKVGKLYGEGKNLQEIAEAIGDKERMWSKRYLAKFCKIASETLFQLGDSNKKSIESEMDKAAKDLKAEAKA